MNPKWYYIKCINQELIVKIRVFSLPDNIKFVEEIIKRVGQKRFKDANSLEEKILNALGDRFYAATNEIEESSPEYDMEIHLRVSERVC